MSLVLADRVRETTETTGTGTITLVGAVQGFQSFAVIGNNNTTYYTINRNTEWEVGIGTYYGGTLSRDTVYASSNGGAKVNFSAGSKDVFVTYPASKSVNEDANNRVLIPYTTGTTNVGSLNVGDATAHTDSGVIAGFTASEPLYLYISLQNTSSANTSYASYAVNDGGHTAYGELGINNANYSYTAAGFPNNGFSTPLASFVESYGGPLVLGSWDNQKISMIINGAVSTTDAMTINTNGSVAFNGQVGTAGQVLQSNATSAPTWVTPSSSGGLTWAAVQTANFTASAGNAYPVNTTSGAITVTLPASPTAGQFVTILDYAGTAGTNNITINPNGNKIQGGNNNLAISINRQAYNFVYVDATQGWLSYAQEYTLAPYAPYSISYLIAGGGAGAADGGGGAGGLVTGTTTFSGGNIYTITVGAGGAGSTSTTGSGVSGSNSSITGLTTALGGGGVPNAGNGLSGGSGGGGDADNLTTHTGGSGTSGQGNAGGGSGFTTTPYSSGGGGGAGAVGGSSSSASVSGNGGNGSTTTLITTSQATSASVGQVSGGSVYFSGGGGGGIYVSGAYTPGTGGLGGGGNGSASTTGTSAPANTGGGGGGGITRLAGNGGSGCVLISVPSANYSGTTTGSPTVVTNGSNTVMIFKSSGSYTA